MKVLVLANSAGRQSFIFLEDSEQPEAIMESDEVVMYEEPLVQDLPVPVGIRLTAGG